MSLNVPQLQRQILAWYGKSKRVMPWRLKKPNPYYTWLSEIMLQQTTVATVGAYFLKFIDKWPTVEDLARADLDDVLNAWAGLGYYARARNLHKCAQEVAKRGGFPDTVEELLELPGVGPYTAAAIASIAFNKQAVAVDGNVERVVARFFAVEEPLPQSKETLRAHAATLAKNNPRPTDFTQAFMELGATVCTPKNPKCGACPWNAECRGKANAEELPRKSPKAEKPTRYGKVFWVEKKGGAFLVEKKKAKGLYEGLYLLPTTEWVTDKKKVPAATKGYEPLNLSVRHSFTHFDLVLDIWRAKSAPKAGTYAASTDEYALPTLMKKVVALCAKRR